MHHPGSAIGYALIDFLMLALALPKSFTILNTVKWRYISSAYLSHCPALLTPILAHIASTVLII